MFRPSTIARTLAIGIATIALAACSASPGASSPADPTAPPTLPPTAAPSPTPSPTEPPSTPEPSPSEAAASPKALPSIDQATLDAMLTSSITLLNLAEADLSVVVMYREAEAEAPFPLGEYILASTDQQTYEVPAGFYDLQFGHAGSGAGDACTIALADGDAYTFVAVDGAVAIARAGDAPTQASELFVATSSLCIE